MAITLACRRTMGNARPQPLAPHELIVDSFAGGGGASLGIYWATGRHPDIAINHERPMIELHRANHPTTLHYCEDVWDVVPMHATQGRPVGLMWLSPDCKHFSKAKGGRPVSRRVRGLARVAVRWARQVQPRVIVIENVEEFVTWGPLLDNDKPDPERKGTTFRRFVRDLRSAGYAVEYRQLTAADFGAPTSRTRFYLIARCDGAPIVWPKPTHSRGGVGGLRPYRAASEIVDWSIPVASIFLTKSQAAAWAKRHGRRPPKRPLAAKTLRRLAAGTDRYVIHAERPFIAPERAVASMEATTDHVERVAAFVAKHQSERDARQVMATSLFDPLPTVKGRDSNALVVASLLSLRGTGATHLHGDAIEAPLRTISAGGTHHALVTAFVVAYYGNEKDGGSLFDPLRTVTGTDRFGLVTLRSSPHAIVDLGMRMFSPRELFRAQGFPDSYVIDVPWRGKPMRAELQTLMAGNAVCPDMARALIAANLGHEAQQEVAA